MLANYLIGLREGLEAVLVVSIIVAYLVKSGQRNRIKFVWAGVLSAVALATALGAFFTASMYYLPFRTQEILGGALSILTTALVTWMIFWLAKHAKNLKNELHNQVDTALVAGGFALGIVSFLAVGREGIETALFIWNSIWADGQVLIPVASSLLGIGSAILLGVLLFKGIARVNLSKFFYATGLALIFVAAGVLAYGMHDLQEAAILPGLNNLAFDVSSTIPPEGLAGTLLKGVFNFSPKPSQLEVIVWFLYLVPTLFIFHKISSGSQAKNITTKSESSQVIANV